MENEGFIPAKTSHHLLSNKIPHYLPRKDGQYSRYVVLPYVLSSSTSVMLHAAAEMKKH